MSPMGQGKRTVEDREIISAMDNEGEPAYTTSEVADMVKMSTEGVRNRLNQLEREDMVCSKKPSPRTVIWWLPQNQETFSA
jgi:predicted ArsR family transcriptional regulator